MNFPPQSAEKGVRDWKRWMSRDILGCACVGECRSGHAVAVPCSAHLTPEPRAKASQPHSTADPGTAEAAPVVFNAAPGYLRDSKSHLGTGSMEAQGFERLDTSAACPLGVYPCLNTGVCSFMCVFLHIFCLFSFLIHLIFFPWNILGNLTSNRFKVQ